MDETRERVSLNECGTEPSANSFLPPPQHRRHREGAHRVDQIVSEQCMHELGTALRDEVGAVLLFQTLHVGDVAEEHRALPARMRRTSRIGIRTARSGQPPGGQGPLEASIALIVANVEVVA